MKDDADVWAENVRRICDGYAYPNRRELWRDVCPRKRYSDQNFNKLQQALRQTPGAILAYREKAEPNSNEAIGWFLTNDRAADQDRHGRQINGRYTAWADRSGDLTAHAPAEQHARILSPVVNQVPREIDRVRIRLVVRTVTNNGLLEQYSDGTQTFVKARE